MVDDLDRRAHQVFVEALDLEGSAQVEFVARACGDNEKLRRAVDSLLAAVSKSTDFLESPALTEPLQRPGRILAADAIEGLRITERLGAGGMAEVYAAEQDSPRRRVAVKILHGALTGTSALQRFRFEGDVLARLNHPGIAQIHGSGTCSDRFGNQVPYFVMEYIPHATTITDYAEQQQLPLRQRLSLFVDVCDTVQYGHQVGVIHRDLKPGNILVDDDGRPRIIDFGIATAAGPGTERLTISQERGHLIGTLNYMSPEQCSGDGRVDTRSDVYSLGVVLYELVTGARPYDLSSSSILEAIRTVQMEAPVRPSERSSNVSRELNAIVMKALEKEPERRYATASELAADVRRFLDDRPVLARPATTAYQLRMFAKRNRALVCALAGVAVALLVGIGATTRMAYIANAARVASEKNERVLKQVTDFQESQISGVDVSDMGQRLRADLIGAIRSSLASDPRESLPPVEVDAAVAEFERLASRANFTTLALDALQKNVLERSQVAINEQFADQPIVRAQLLHALAFTMNQLGRREQALPVLEEALRIRQQELGDDHPDTLKSRHGMGVLLGTLGRPEEGLIHLRDVFERKTRLLGRDHPVTMTSADGLGGLYRLMGDHEQAERIWRRTLTDRRRILGDDHEDTLISLNNMGLILAVQGKFAEAEVAWRELLERRRKQFGEDDPRYRAGLSNLGELLLQQGKLMEARPLLEQSLNALRAEKGDDHPSTLLTMLSLAELRWELGDLAGAEQLLRENLESRSRILTEDHPDTLRALVAMAEFEHDQGRATQATHTVRQALDAQRRIVGDDHPDTIKSLQVLASMLADDGRFEESESLYREALEAAKRTLEATNPLTGECLGGYGKMLVAVRRWDEAEQRLLKAYDILLASRGPQAKSTREVAKNLVALYETRDGDAD